MSETSARSLTWLHRLTVGLISVSIALTLLALAPIVAHALGWSQTTVSFDEDEIRRPSRKIIASDPYVPLFGDRGDPFAQRQPGATPPGLQQIAMVAKTTPLYRSPDPTAKPEGALKAGESVLVLRGDEDWVLVMRRSDDQLDHGWVRREDLDLR